MRVRGCVKLPLLLSRLLQAADKMAKLTAALCLSCASAMVYQNPTAVTARRTGVSFLPVKLQSGNSKATLQNSSHVRIAREARSGQRPGTAPQHNSTSAALCVVCEGKNLLDRAGRGARSREPRARARGREQAAENVKKTPPQDTTIERAEAGNKIEQGKMKRTDERLDGPARLRRRFSW